MGCTSVLEHLFVACGGSLPREGAEERKRKSFSLPWEVTDLDFSVMVKSLGP